MNKVNAAILVKRIIVICSFVVVSFYATSQNHPALPGEKLTYSMHLGWFNMGKAEIWIDPEIQYIDGEAHYQIQCTVTTSSLVRFFKSLDACYESLVNVETLRPLKSNRDLKFGKDIDVRTDKFSFNDEVKVHAYVEDLDEDRYHTFVEEDDLILDFLSTYLFVRNWSSKKENTPLEIKTFYSNSLYEFKMTPDSYGEYKWDGREINSREFKLIFPKNEMFKKGKHGELIISNDRSCIPLRIDINIILGSFYFKLEEIDKYS